MPQHLRVNQKGFGHHFVLPLLAILAVGAIGFWLTFGSRAAEIRPAPKQGWVDDGEYVTKNPATNPSTIRNYNGSGNEYSFAITRGGLRHTVLNVGVGELVSVAPTWPYETTYKANSIESRIQKVVDWNNAHPTQKLTVHLRFHVGKSAPQTWKEVCGTVKMKDSSFGVEADAPRWWVKDEEDRDIYRKLYENAMVTLGRAVSNINSVASTTNIIGSVNAPGAAPNYPEPMIIYAGDRTHYETRDGVRLLVIGTNERLREAGFDAAKHDAFMMWFPTMAVHFPGVAVELAVNPYQNIAADGSMIGASQTKYKQVAQSLIDTIHGRAVIANYSAREAYFDPSITTRNAYKSMYSWMVGLKTDRKAWIGLQLARPPRVATTSPDTNEKWDDVARWAAAQGFNFIETTGKASVKIDGHVVSGRANIWPSAYNDDSNDISDMLSIGRTLKRNPHP